MTDMKIDEYQNLNGLVTRVKSLPNIEKWLKSRPVTAM